MTVDDVRITDAPVTIIPLPGAAFAGVTLLASGLAFRRRA